MAPSCGQYLVTIAMPNLVSTGQILAYSSLVTIQIHESIMDRTEAIAYSLSAGRGLG